MSDILRIGEYTQNAVRVLDNNDRAMYASLSNIHFVLTTMIDTARARESGYGLALTNVITASNVALDPLPTA